MHEGQHNYIKLISGIPALPDIFKTGKEQTYMEDGYLGKIFLTRGRMKGATKSRQKTLKPRTKDNVHQVRIF